MEIQEALSQALDFIQHDQRVAARTVLGQIIREHPDNEEAWILSAQVSDKAEQVVYCLQRAIQINPDSARARFFLEQLQQSGVSIVAGSSNEPAPSPEPVVKKPDESLPGGTIAEQPIAASAITPSGTGDSDANRPGPAVAFPQPAKESDQPALPGSPEQQIINEANANQAQSTVVRTGEPPITETHTAASLETPEQKNAPASQLLAQVALERRPTRWLQRIFTLAGSACLFAPWITLQSADSPARSLSVAQILLETLQSSLYLELAFAAVAGLALLFITFFRFKSGPTQKWGERSTIALSSLACLPALILIASFYTGSSSIVGLDWGIWANWAFFSLAGLAAVINARRLGHLGRKELSAARAGRVFTWLFSLSNVLAILLTVAALVQLGKANPIGIGIPVVWLGLGAFLSHFA